MSADNEPLGAQLERLLRAQADSRDAPDWIADFLAGKDVKAERTERGDLRVVITGPGGETCEIEVHLSFKAPPPVPDRPWQPAGAGLPRDGLEKLAYIVVDEIVGEDVDLSVSSWPMVDDRGRLLLPAQDPRAVHTEVEELAAYVNRPDVRAGRGVTEIRMGTALAAEVRPAGMRGARPRLEKWLVPPVYDITAPARDKAKAAFYAAVAPALKHTEVEEIREAASE
jgi:hypothetical protein